MIPQPLPKRQPGLPPVFDRCDTNPGLVVSGSHRDSKFREGNEHMGHTYITSGNPAAGAAVKASMLHPYAVAHPQSRVAGLV
jgi:hypothetical protein